MSLFKNTEEVGGEVLQKLKKKIRNSKRVHKKTAKRVLIYLALIFFLIFQVFAPVNEVGKLTGFTENSAEAATLADVEILTNVAVNASLSNLEGPASYNLNLSLTGTGLADVDLVNPETVALFHAPDLAGDIGVTDLATVRVEILPITLDDLPVLDSLLSGLIDTLTSAVSGIVGLLGDITALIPDRLLEVKGLEELQNAIGALSNVDEALADLLVYEDTIPAEVSNETGTITVDFSNNLNNHLETAVNDVVLQLLNDVIEATQALEINLLGSIPIVGALVNGLINSILNLATGTILPAVEGVVSDITAGTADLTRELVAAQVIGETQIDLTATVNKDTDASGEIPISGTAVNTNAIDVNLLNTLNPVAIVMFPEIDTTAPEITSIADITVVENTSIVPIVVNVNEPSDISVEGLPDGITYNPNSNTISGIPIVDDWGLEEVERAFQVTVTATDESENIGIETFTVTVQRDTDGNGTPDITDPPDTTAPDAPIVDPVYSNDVVVSGTGEAGTRIVLTIGGENYEGEVDSEGNFSVSIPQQETGTVITAVLIDDAGNVSEASEVTVIEATVSFLYVPESILFEPIEIDSKPVVAQRQDPDWSIEVIDTRGEGSNWRLTAQAEQPLVSMSDSSRTLPNPLVYVDEQNYSQSLASGPVEVFSGVTGADPITSVYWEENQGPLVQITPTDAYAETYSTTITWELVDAP